MGLEEPTKEWYAINFAEDEEEELYNRDKLAAKEGRIGRVPGKTGRTGTMTMTGRLGRIMIATKAMMKTHMDRCKEATEKKSVG